MGQTRAGHKRTRSETGLQAAGAGLRLLGLGAVAFLLEEGTALAQEAESDGGASGASFNPLYGSLGTLGLVVVFFLLNFSRIRQRPAVLGLFAIVGAALLLVSLVIGLQLLLAQ